MNFSIRLSLLVLFLSQVSFALTREAYVAEIISVKSRNEVARTRIGQVKAEITAAKEDIDALKKLSNTTWDSVLNVLGVSQTDYNNFLSSLDSLRSAVDGFTSFGEDFPGWEKALRQSQKDLDLKKLHPVKKLTRAADDFSAVDRALTGSASDLLATKEAKVAREGRAKEEKTRLAAEAKMVRETKAPALQGTGAAGTLTVEAGNSLWRFAARPEIYGDGKLWKKIFEANRDQLQDPNLILPGQHLAIPK